MAAHDSDGGTLEQRNLRLVRFADDYLLLFEDHADAQQMLAGRCQVKQP
jgi:hypothetical protein